MGGYTRVFILGLDGLEHDFVERWNLTHLKQFEYGKIHVPVQEKVDVPITPEVWAAFLTGKYVHVDFARNKPSFAYICLINLLRFFRRYINLSLGLGGKIRENIPARLWKPYIVGFQPLKEKTFLDLINSKKIINVPFYNYDNAVYVVIRNFEERKFSLKETIERLKATYEEGKEQILHEAEKSQNVSVTFAYMHFPDALQHFLFTRPLEIRRLYMDLNNYVSVLKSKIKDSTLFLIVSDHGFNLVTGTHSKHGFYSSNRALNPKPKQITDFYRIILQVVGVEQKH